MKFFCIDRTDLERVRSLQVMCQDLSGACVTKLIMAVINAQMTAKYVYVLQNIKVTVTRVK